MTRTPPNPDQTARGRLGEIVGATADAAYQGRRAELARFRELLSAPERLPRILSIHGPPGIGKSAFLDACRRACEREGLGTMLVLDSSEFPHDAEALKRLLRKRLGAWPPAPDGSPVALAIDTFEQMDDMQWAFRTGFVEELQGPVLLILAGRRPIREVIGQLAGWNRFIEQIRLEALSPAESRAYLVASGLEEEAELERILALAGGHPLALSIAADLAAQRAGESLSKVAASRQVMRALAQRLSSELRSEGVRELLEAAALVRTFDEELLEAMVGHDASAAFDEFCRLSVVRVLSSGLSIHEAVRNLLAEDMRWRRPERYLELRRRAVEHLARLAGSGVGTSFDITLELLFLSQETVIQRAFFDPLPPVELRPATPEDIGFIRALAGERAPTTVGTEPDRLLRHLDLFLRVAPERFLVAVRPDGAPIGFCNTVPLNRATLPALGRIWGPYFASLPSAELAEYRAERGGSAAAGLVAGMVMASTGQEAIMPALLQEVLLRGLRGTRRLVVMTPYERFKRLAERLLFQPALTGVHLFGDEVAHDCYVLDLGEDGFEAWIQRLLTRTG